MAGTTALHPLHSKEATSSSSKSSKAKKPSDEFQKKLATAKRQTISKPVVIDLAKKPVPKPEAKPAAEIDGESQDDAEAKGSIEAETTEENTTPVIAEKSATPAAKTKPSADKTNDAAADPEKPAVAQAHREVAAIHPDAKHSQPREQPQTKARSPNATVHAAVGTPLHAEMDQAVNSPSQTVAFSPADDDADSQGSVKTISAVTASTDSTSPVDADSQLASQPTFGAASADGHSGTSDSDASNRNASSAADSAAEDSTADSAASAVGVTFAGAIADAVASARTSSTDSHAAPTTTTPQAIGLDTQTTSTQQTAAISKTAANVATSAQARFVEENHPKIVTGISGQLMPKGGTMQLRLDPQGLGQMQVTVHLREGSMSAEFQTSSEEATRMLSHSLGQLKSTLETAGMTVEKLHVEQAPKKDSQSQNDSDAHTAPHEQQQQAQQDKQRREMMQRMWAKLAGDDDLDMVA